jgi:signal peptidase II
MPDQNGISALRWFAIAATVLLLDQLTKLWIMAEFALGDSRFISSFFNLVRAHNEGAAFSFLSDAGGWQRWFFTVVAVVISGVLTVWLFMAPRAHWLLGLSLALILGGAIGNVWDRVALGYVVDFISVHYQGWYFPAFNIADSAITVGAICMLLDSFFNRHSEQA